MSRTQPIDPALVTDEAGTRTSGATLILDNAARLFRVKGYAATSLRDIASASGMKAGSLYYYFDSKDAIVSEVLRLGVTYVLAEVRRAVEALGDEADAHELFQTAVTAHLRALLQSENYTSANIRIFGQVPPEIKEKHLPLRDIYERFWADLFARCSKTAGFNPDRNLRYARLFLLGTLNSTLDWFDPDRAPVEEVSKELTAIFLNGMTGQ
jgi:AcrR family transcriptional regulator